MTFESPIWFFVIIGLIMSVGIGYRIHAETECDGDLVVKASGLYKCIED